MFQDLFKMTIQYLTKFRRALLNTTYSTILKDVWRSQVPQNSLKCCLPSILFHDLTCDMYSMIDILSQFNCFSWLPRYRSSSGNDLRQMYIFFEFEIYYTLLRPVISLSYPQWLLFAQHKMKYSRKQQNTFKQMQNKLLRTFFHSFLIEEQLVHVSV